jgi:hypothetical protein
MTDKKRAIRRISLSLLLLLTVFLYVLASLKPPPPEYYAEGTRIDFFGADLWRVTENINDTAIKHYRDRVHPLFSLAATTPTVLLKQAFGCDNNACGLKIYQALFGTLGLFFFILVLHEVSPRPVAVVLPTVLLFCSSATWKMWSHLPETSLYAFFSINLAIYLFLRFESQEGRIASGVASFSGTITNGGLGLLLQFFSLKGDRKKLVGCVAATLGVLAVLALVQRNIYPTSIPFFDLAEAGEEARYINKDVSELPWRTLDFALSPLALPWFTPPGDSFSSIAMLKTFFGNFGAQTRRALLGFFTLVVLFGFVVFQCRKAFVDAWRNLDVSAPAAKQVIVVRSLVIFIVAQYVLHLIYGDMPFLYAMHFLPGVIIILTYFAAKQLPRLYPVLVTLAVVATQEMNAGLYSFLFPR